MTDLKQLQKAVYDNKVAHNFNVTDVNYEFCLLYGEVGEAYRAYLREGKQAYAEELADIAIYLLGLAEITGVDLENEILRKMEKNRKRVYRALENGVMVNVEDAEEEKK